MFSFNVKLRRLLFMIHVHFLAHECIFVDLKIHRTFAVQAALLTCLKSVVSQLRSKGAASVAIRAAPPCSVKRRVSRTGLQALNLKPEKGLQEDCYC